MVKLKYHKQNKKIYGKNTNGFKLLGDKKNLASLHTNNEIYSFTSILGWLFRVKKEMTRF